MAIDNIPFADTDKLAYPDKSFYPLKIPVSHWQLRHYISHPEKDVLYYASGQDIYYLNTATKKRKHITTLPFEARCTASGHGYLCVGGEDEGHFAVIKLESRSADVDAPLPLHYAPAQRSTVPYAASIKVERIGEEIVNSISIHQIRDEEAHLYDVVAVLTNNDKTVRVYSLAHGIETAVLDLPFPMNHASISPDGTMLVAVGDMNTAYFFSRVLQVSPPQIPKPHNRLNMSKVGWDLLSDAKLHLPEASMHAGYFTTAWSPNGNLVAVGSEAGFIVVFDMTLLALLSPGDVEDAIVATIPSSRPNVQVHMHPGAVRSMLFSPEPWDLLIWAEDQGRLCIADLRTGLRAKQVVDLDPKQDGLLMVQLEDVPLEEEYALSRRLLELEDENLRGHRRTLERASAVNYTAQVARYVEARHRQLQHRRASPATLASPQASPHGRNVSDDDSLGLTAHEQQILESLRTTRQREEARAQGGTPRSVNYTTPSMFPPPANGRGNAASFDDVLTAPPTANARGNTAFVDNLPTVPPTLEESTTDEEFPELARASRLPRAALGDEGDDTLPPLTALQEYQRDLMYREHLHYRDRQQRARRAQDESQHSQASPNTRRWHPRRRASVVLSVSGPITATPTGSNAIPIPPHATRATLPSTSTPPNGDEDDDTPWRTITNAMNVVRESNYEAAAESALPQRDSDRIRMLARQRDRLESLQRSLEATASITTEMGDEARAATATGTAGTAGASLPSRYESLRTATSAARGFQDGYDVLLRRRTLAAASTATGREIGVRTSGLAVSRDGETVWAATETGIFEIKLALKRRMCWPAVELR